MKKKKSVVMMTALVLLSTSISYADYSDIQGHWAKDSIVRAIENKILVGSNGRFFPKENITRGQLASMLSKALSYKTSAPINYSDVKSGQWYFDPISKLSAKNLTPDTEHYEPKAQVSRKEAFLLLAKAFHLKSEGNEHLLKFGESETLSDSEKPYFEMLLKKGYLVGAEGKLNLDKPITRAEFAGVMDRLVVRYVDAPTKISGKIEGNMVVRSKGVVFENAHISGRIIFADGLDEKDVELKDSIASEGLVFVSKGEEIADTKTPLAPAPNNGSNRGGGSGGSAGSSGGSGGSSNSGGGNTGGGNSGSTPSQPSEKFLDSVLDISKTKIISVGYASYLTIVFKEGTADDYRIFVDGNQISVRAVNDENTIVKWEIQHLNHRELKIVRISDKMEGIYDLQTKTIK